MNYNLLNGDCLQLMETIPDNSVDMVLCDMPYGTTECKWDKTLDLTVVWTHINRITKIMLQYVYSQPNHLLAY